MPIVLTGSIVLTISTTTIVLGVDMGKSTGFTLVSSMATASNTLTNPVTKFHL